MARIVLGVWRAAAERNLGLISAGVAFFALLAIFPAAAALIAFWGFLYDPAVIEAQLELLADFVPQEAFGLLSAQVDRLVRTNDSTLGWTTIVSLAATLWSARLGVGALIQGLNAVHGSAVRGGVGHTLTALSLTLVLMGVGLVALASIVVLPIILAFAPLGSFTGVALEIGKWIVAVSVVLGGISLVFRFGPNRKPRTPWFSAGLVLSVTLWAAASVAFSWLLTSFGNYNEVYGSIAAVIALLMWFYISAYAVLLGGALNYRIEAEKARQAVDRAPPAPD